MKTKTELKMGLCREFMPGFAVLVSMVSLLVTIASSPAQTYRILHHFGTNTMGLNPIAPVVQGPDNILYGVASAGGAGNAGQIFSVKTDGTDYRVLRNFTGGDEALPGTRLVLSGTTLYGTTGASGGGTIFKVQTDGSGYAVLKRFTGSDGSGPNVGLILSGTALFGATEWGGSADFGTVFRINIDGSGFSILKDFTSEAGPSGLVLSGGNLFGTTSGGGTTGAGTVFELKTDGSGFAVLKNLDWDESANPEGELMLSGSTLYGTTRGGGSAGAGVIYKLETDGSGFAILRDFTNSADGEELNGDLLLSGPSLYGTASYGGIHNSGTVFRINTNGNEFAVLCEFSDSIDGYTPMAGLVLSGTTLYGTTASGGAFGYGTVFKLQTDGSGYNRIVEFKGGDGTGPGDIVLSGGTFFGVTSSGGGSGNGTIFKINADGSSYEILKEFTNYLEGAFPSCRLLVDGSTIYGSASYGGAAWNGTMFKLNTNGSGYTVLKDFTNLLEGGNPSGEMAISGATLYGTTSMGGMSNCGTVLKMGTDGNEFAILRHFQGGDGRQPAGGLVLTGSRLYGTTYWGGSNDCGTVFTMDTNGGMFSVVKHFNGEDGYMPGDLLLENGTLYGTGGGGNGYGTVFKINTDGSDFADFSPFDWEDGDSGPVGKLCLNGETLFGATIDSAVFQINTDGSNFAVLKRLTNGDGYYPYAGTILQGSTLFGTASYGGALDSGVVFSLSLLPGVVEVPPSRTIEAGSSILFSMQATGSSPFDYEWLCDGTNLPDGPRTNLLSLTDLTLAHSGAYSLAISNVFGSFTSAPVMLQVIPVVETRLVPGIRLTGGSIGAEWNVEYADSPAPGAGWEPLATVGLDHPAQYCFDDSLPLPPLRFYRAIKTGEPLAILSLGLNFYPALTVAGDIGSTYRVDTINPIGPTDAWITLGTITLTKKSQLYFDATAPGPPTRLYQMVPVP